MASIARFRVSLNGFQGAPGVNTFHALDIGQGPTDQTAVDDFAAQLFSMYSDLHLNLPLSVTAAMVPEVDVFDVADGTLQERFTVGTPWSRPGADASSQTSRATHAKFRYKTDAIVGNRFLQGGIYFGPISDGPIQDDGTLSASFLTEVSDAHDGLLDVAGPLRLAIWAQPKQGQSDGAFGYVQSVSAMPVPAVLRSRRD